MKRSTKRTLKTIGLGLLGLLVLGGAIFGISSLVEKQDEELKVIHPVFEVGGLNEVDGKYEKSDKTLYTKNAFECQGLEIKLDFDNTIKYQVFFYESDGDYLGSTEVFDGNEDIDVPLFASHARIELTPNWAEMGEDYDTEKEQIVKWYETTKYGSQLEVKVNKEQVEVSSTIDLDISAISKGSLGGTTGNYDANNTTLWVTDYTDVIGGTSLSINKVPSKIVFYNNDEAFISLVSGSTLNSGDLISVPENAKYFRLEYKTAEAESGYGDVVEFANADTITIEYVIA